MRGRGWHGPQHVCFLLLPHRVEVKPRETGPRAVALTGLSQALLEPPSDQEPSGTSGVTALSPEGRPLTFLGACGRCPFATEGQCSRRVHGRSPVTPMGSHPRLWKEGWRQWPCTVGFCTRLALPGAGTVDPHPLSKGERGKRLRSGCENVSPTPPSPPTKGTSSGPTGGTRGGGEPPALRHTHPEAASKPRGWGQDEGCGQSAEGDPLRCHGAGSRAELSRGREGGTCLGSNTPDSRFVPAFSRFLLNKCHFI